MTALLNAMGNIDPETLVEWKPYVSLFNTEQKRVIQLYYSEKWRYHFQQIIFGE